MGIRKRLQQQIAGAPAAAVATPVAAIKHHEVEHHDPHDHIHPEPQSFFRRYLFSTDHKIIGIQFLLVSLLMFVIGGLLAMLVRWQLAYPNVAVPFGEFLPQNMAINGAMTPDGYNIFFTMHASVMIFYVIIPMLVGAFGNYLIPLQIGARDMAFPFLNALAFWTALPAGMLMLAGFMTGGGASTGWTAYPPISTQAAQTNTGQTLWICSIILLGFSSMMGAINYLTTIINMRAPGMTMFRMPMPIWALFITSLLILFATPVLTSGLMMLLMDRTLGSKFFQPFEGGQPLLFQHLFWFYSHPAVYIMILPGMGIASEVLAVFSRKPIFGYRAMVYAIAGIAGLGFIVWGHHMFQSGMNPYLGTTFMVSTMAIAIPSAIKTFNWLGTLWGGTIRFTVPMLNGLAFVAMFVIGGLSGIFMASTSVDIFIHDTYFIVGHIHYVLFGGSVFAIFAGIYFWFPKMFGRQMDERLGKLHFWLTFVSYNCTFFPMHILGIGGMMRRIATPTMYVHLEHWQPLNVFVTLSAFTLGLAQIPFIINFVGSMFARRRVNFAWRGLFNLAVALTVALWLATQVDFLLRGSGAPVNADGSVQSGFFFLPWIYTYLAALVFLGAFGGIMGGLQVMPRFTQHVLITLLCVVAALPYVKLLDFLIAWPTPGVPEPSAVIPGLGVALYSYGSVVAAGLLGALVAVYIGHRPILLGTDPGDNPWEATTLEWQLTSPPFYANFHKIPTVYHGAYEYSVPGQDKDWLAQTDSTQIAASGH